MSMANPTPDKRLVYLHCRSIFTGTNAQVRREKVVLKLLEKHKGSIKILTHEFPLCTICTVAKELLEEGIFESKQRAKLHFPELFEVSKARAAEREASEAEAAKSEAEALEEVVALLDSDEGVGDVEGDDNDVMGMTGEKVEEERRLVVPMQEARVPNGDRGHDGVGRRHTQLTSLDRAKIHIPSLHPVYMPYKTQHRILTRIQSMLEESCFEFGKRWLPELLASQGWESPEAVELNTWTKKLLKHMKDIPPSATDMIAGKSWKEVLFATNALRHAAVHRLRTTVAGILGLIDSAIALAKMLLDAERVVEIGKIRDGLQSSSEAMLQSKNLLESKLLDELDAIATRRAELDDLERLAIENMTRSDKGNQTSIGLALDDFLERLERGETDSPKDLGIDLDDANDTSIAILGISALEDSHSAAETHASNTSSCLRPKDTVCASHSHLIEDSRPFPPLNSRVSPSSETAHMSPVCHSLLHRSLPAEEIASSPLDAIGHF